MDKDKLEKLKKLLEVANDGLDKKTFDNAFKTVVDLVVKVEKSLIEKINQAVSGFKEEISDIIRLFKEDYGALKTNTEIDLSNLETEYQEKLDIALKEQSDGLNFIRDKVRKIKEGIDGKDGYTPIRNKDYFDGKDGSPDAAEQVRDKLETLTDDDKLEISAIKNLQEQLDELKNRPLGGSGGGGFSKMAMTQYFIFKETPTGTVDGVNTDFVLNYTPSPANSLTVYVGTGIMHLTEDFTFSNKIITFLTAPPTGAVIRCDYLR